MEICTYYERVVDKVPKFCHIYSIKCDLFNINYQTNGIIDEIITLMFTLKLHSAKYNVWLSNYLKAGTYLAILATFPANINEIE